MTQDFPDLPPYTYVPGHAPHPVSHPDGHMRDEPAKEDWSDRDFLRWGKHLFEHGYYWEAHEAWEHLWLELGRTSADALIVKGLIKLAAGAVKCREGNATGATRHATRAAELLANGSGSTLFEEVKLAIAYESAVSVRENPPVDHAEPSNQPVVLPLLKI